MIKIRSASEQDIPALVNLSWALNAAFDCPVAPEETALARNWGQIDALVAEADGAIVGFMAGTENFLLHMGRSIYTLHSLFVAPAYRQQGITRRLFEALCDDLRRRNVFKITVQVGKENDNARAIYEALGAVESPHAQWHTTMEYYL
ncbi:MAG: GNAT family N-acetyltransferase [Alphaproteobacteria bacterium]|nr:GNAT family N-acetyltransferase [Alphaproteobacteria bacterium]